MNRESALNELFDDPEAGFVSGDEPDDCCEIENEVEDEIDIDLERNIEEALALENELTGFISQQHLEQAYQMEQIDEPVPKQKKRGRGRPRKNLITSITTAPITRPITTTNSQINTGLNGNLSLISVYNPIEISYRKIPFS